MIEILMLIAYLIGIGVGLRILTSSMENESHEILFLSMLWPIILICWIGYVIGGFFTKEGKKK